MYAFFGFINFFFVSMTSFFLWQIRSSYKYVEASFELAQHAVSYEQRPEHPVAEVLIIGDSLGYGVGAESPERSIAGWLGADFPKLKIENKSVYGSMARHTYATLKEVDHCYDVIFIHVGANDILWWVPLNDTFHKMGQLLEIAKKRANHVVLMTAGNFGNVPLFPWAIRRVLEWRTRMAEERFEQIAQEHEVIYVDIFRERKDDLFFKAPNRYYSVDMLHPNGEGYKVFYEEIRKTLKRHNIDGNKWE